MASNVLTCRQVLEEENRTKLAKKGCIGTFAISNLQGKMSLYLFFLMFSGCSDAAVG